MAAALDDGPEGLTGPVCKPFMTRPTSLQPPQRPLHAFPCQIVGCLPGDDVIERHGDVRAHGPLNLRRPLGGEGAVSSVHVALKLDAFFRDFSQPLEREDLEPPRIGEHGPVPGGEPMEAPHGAHGLLAWAEMQMIGVAQDDLGPGAPDVAGAEPTDHAEGADRHERGGLHQSMGERQSPRARHTGGAINLKLEHHHARKLSP
jgi:hypothetical protein